MGKDIPRGQSRDRRILSAEEFEDAASIRLPVAEAAEHLGVKEDTIRKRIQRGTLESVKIGSRVHVYVPQDEYLRAANKYQDKSKDTSRDKPDTSRDELVRALREQVAYLQSVIATRDQELAQRAEEIRRRDSALEREQQLAAIFVDRLRELEAPQSARQEPRESPVSSEPTRTPSRARRRRSTWPQRGHTRKRSSRAGVHGGGSSSGSGGSERRRSQRKRGPASLHRKVSG